LYITGRKGILALDLSDSETESILEIKDSEKKVIIYIETFWFFDYEGKTRLVYFEEYFKGSKRTFVFESIKL